MQSRQSSHRLAIHLALTCLMGLASSGAARVAGAADDPRFVASASASTVQVAEAFSLELTVTSAAGNKVLFPAAGDRLGDFDVLETQDVFDIPDPLDPQRRTWTRRITLESIVTGERTIPALEVQVVGDGGRQVLQSDPIPVQVLSVLENRSDPLQFRDIQSVVDVPVPHSSHAWVWWTLGSVAGLAFVVAAIRMWRREKWLSPRDWAMMKLDQLSDSLSAQPAASDAVASRISSILREYLQLQFDLPDPGQSPQELLETLKARHEIDSDTAQRIETQFALADQVSFARWPLSEQQRHASIVQARLIVESTSGDSPSQDRPLETPIVDCQETP